MAVVTTTSPLTGFQYSFRIAGETPTQQERETIAQYLIQTEGSILPGGQAPDAGDLVETEDSQGLLAGIGSGFGSAFASIPEGIASLGEAALGYTPGETAFGQGAAEVTDTLQEGVDYLFGQPTDDVASKSGQTIGSLASFLVPGLGAAKAASLAGAGAKAASAIATGVAATQGVGLGSKEQVDRLARAIESGQDIERSAQTTAVLFGGAIGATEALPVNRVFGQISKLLKGVPKAEKANAANIIKRRLKNAGTQGLIEAGQEVAAAILQDLTEKNIYNPNLDIALSAYQDDAIYGGGAGATLQFLIDTVAGRKARKAFDKVERIERDLQEESAESGLSVENALASAGMARDDEGNLVTPQPAPKPSLPVPITEEEVEVSIDTEQDVGPTPEQIAESDRIKKLGLDDRSERELQAQKQREILAGGHVEIELKTLPPVEQQAVRQYRQRTGEVDIDAPIGIVDLQDIITDRFGADRGIEVYNRESVKQKPTTFEPKLTKEEQKERDESLKAQQKVTENFEGLKQDLRTGDIVTKSGVISIPKIQRKYKMNRREATAAVEELRKKGHATPISPTQHKPVLPEEIAEPQPSPEHERLRKTEAQLLELEQQTREATRELNELKERGATNAQEQAEIDAQQALVDDAGRKKDAIQQRVNELQARANNVAPENADGVDPAQMSANVARQAAVEAEAAPPTPEYKRKINAVANALRKYLRELGVSDIELVSTNVINPKGIATEGFKEGYQQRDKDGKEIITIAMEIYDPNLTEDQLLQRLRGVVNHELIHSLRSMGLITDAEFANLVKVASKRKYQRKVRGELKDRDYTFLDRAEVLNPNQTPEYIAEEAVAEMFRAYADGRLKVAGKPKSIFQKIVRFFKAIFQAHNDAGFRSAADLFDGIQSGKVGRRERNLNRARQAPAGARYSTAGVRAGFAVPDKGDIERINQNFKDVTKRIPQLTEAANKLINDEIEYEEYDGIVNEFKPIIPYETVPAPEGYRKMYDAMEKQNVLVADPRQNFKQKVKKQDLVGTANQIVEDGQTVGIRLDIPSYRDSGTWIVSVHAGKQLRFREGEGGLLIPENLTAGSPLSYESTAVVTGPVAFGMAEKGALKIASGSSKGTIATFQGNWKNMSPDEAFALAQEMLTDPNVVQVGMDPERHSYFYDRMTTQPVIGADLVVQVGPLVLARNPQFAPKSDFKYSVKPIVDTQGKTKLTHYSPIPDLNIIDPEEQGTNRQMTGVERYRRAAFADIYPARSYFGMNVGEDRGYVKERVVGDNTYFVDYPIESLYDWQEDPEGFKAKALKDIPPQYTTDNDRSMYALTMAEKMIKDSGYNGYYTDTNRGLSAAVFTPTEVREDFSTARKESIKRLTPEMYKLTSLGNVNEELGNPENRNYIQKARPNTVILPQAAQAMQDDRGNVVLNWEDEGNWETIATLMSAEAEAAYGRDGSAIGWYDRTLNLAKRITNIVFPDLKPGSADDAAYQYAVSVTSNGVSVIDNWEYAAEQYRNWQKTGKFLIKGYGSQGGSMLKAFEFYNAMIDMGYTDLEIKDFLNQKMTVRELRQNNVVRALGIDVDSSESADTEVFVSYLMGPKIGQGFYQNLGGNFDTLTMDRWWMRMFNRITGEPFETVQERTIENNERRIMQAVNSENLAPYEKMIVDVTKDGMGIDIVTPQNVRDFAINLDKEYQKQRGRFNAAGLAKEIPKKTELFLAATSARRNFEDTLQEDPRTAKQRAVMRAIANRAREILREDTGIDISNADFQALLWYPEKNLFYSYGVQKGKGDDNDYIDGALAFARKEGYDVETIKEALPEADATVVSDRAGSILTDEKSSDGPATTAKQPGQTTEETEKKYSIINGGTRRKLINYMQDNPDGWTLPRSFIDTGETEVPTGFVVAPIKSAELVSGKELPMSLLRDYINNAKYMAEATGGDAYLGGWLEGGEYYFDAVVILDTLEDALYTAQAGDQMAIYDLNTFTPVDTKDGIRQLKQNGTYSSELAERYRRNAEELGIRFEEARIRDSRRSRPRRADRRESVARVSPRNYSTSNSQLANRIDEKVTRLSYNNVSGILAKALGIVTDKDRAEALSERFFTKYQDALLPVGKLYDELNEQGVDIVDAHDAYLQEELSQGRAGYQLEKNQTELFEPLAERVKAIDVDNETLKPLASQSKFVRDYLGEEQPAKLALAEAVLYARHAKERNAYIQQKYNRGMGSGMSDQEADAILNFVATLPPQVRSQVADVTQLADQIIANTNKIREDGDLIPEPGFVDPEGKWQPTNFQNYVPLRGTMDPDEEAGQDYRNAPRRTPNLYGARGRLEARMQGRGDSYAVNIIANLMAQNQQSIQKAERNKVGKAFYDMLMNPEIDSANIAEVLPEYNRQIDNNILTVKIGGKDTHIEIFDDRIARALKGALNPKKANSLVRFMGKINRVLSNLNTSWNPEFVISNLARDLEAAGVQINQYDESGLTQEIVKNAFSAVRGIASEINAPNLLGLAQQNYWSDVYQDFIKAGGKNATNQMSDLQDQVENLKAIVDGIGQDASRGATGLVKNGFKKLGDSLEAWNTAVENGVRVATFDAMRKRGYTEQRAAQAARNVTVNFAKGGEEKAVMNSLYLFYNASLQGSMALANAAARSPKVRKSLGAVLLYGFLQDYLMGSFDDDEDGDGKGDYDELGDYTLEHNLIFPNMFYGAVGGKYIKIPLAYGLNVPFNTGRSIARLSRGEYTVGQATNSITGTLLELVNPLGSGLEDYENIIMPTVIDPFISILANKDYKGDPIYKEGSPFGLAKPDSQMYWNNTSRISKAIANQINSLTGGTQVTPGYIDVSPDILDFWFDYVTGATGAFVRRSAEAPLNIVDYLDGDLQGDLTRQLPLVRKVFTNPSTYEDVGIYMENRDKVLRARKELETAIAYRRPGDIRRVKAEYENLLGIHAQVKALDNARNRLVRQMNKIKNLPLLPQEQKDKRIAQLRERQQELVKRANKVMYDAGIR